MRVQSTPLVVEGRSKAVSSAISTRARFQSTPLVVEGRSWWRAWVTRPRSRSFNPRPSLSRGEAMIGQLIGLQALVSIHAPRCRGAKPPTSRQRPSKSRSFQSTPLVVEGRSISQSRRLRSACCVSIHAPRCRGAKPEWRAVSDMAWAVSIHAPRCRGAKRRSRSAPRWCRCCFNPRPSLSRGEAFQHHPHLALEVGFNPRPSLSRGEAGTRRPAGGRCTRFNPRPSLSRGEAYRCWPRRR